MSKELKDQEKEGRQGCYLKETATKEHRLEICRKGGLKVSEDRAHMSALGKKGGASLLSARGREYFSELGKRPKKYKKNV